MFKNNETQHFNKYAQELNLNKVKINATFNSKLREGKFFLKHLPNSMKGKQILDIGCGVGATSIYFAKKGAKVTGIDISPGMIKKAFALARIHNAKILIFKTADAENLDYPDNNFDIIMGKAILHHINIAKAVKETHRVLRPGGLALFSEPFAYNPLVKIYDKFASCGLRSKGEKRLNLNDIKIIQRTFKKVEWLGIDISTFILFILDFLYLKFTRSKVPINWFERVEYGEVLNSSYNLFDKIDGILPKPIQALGWKIVIVCRK